jgi:hypothetical protein
MCIKSIYVNNRAKQQKYGKIGGKKCPKAKYREPLIERSPNIKS